MPGCVVVGEKRREGNVWMAVFNVQAAFMLKSWPTHNRESYSAMASVAVATHLLAALIIFYDGPCAIKYVHREHPAVVPAYSLKRILSI